MTAHDPALVETVAEAIGVADDYIWGLLTPDEQEPHFIRARAVLDAITTSPRHALIELPEPDYAEPANEDVNGFVEWQYPHGSICTTDDGTIMWGQWHIHEPETVEYAASCLLAAARKARAAESGSTTPETKE